MVGAAVLGTVVALGGQPPPAPPYLTFAQARRAIHHYERTWQKREGIIEGWMVDPCRRLRRNAIVCDVTDGANGEGYTRAVLAFVRDERVVARARWVDEQDPPSIPLR